MIVTDMDCTFLDANKQIPQANIDAVREAQAAGIHVSFGTGRYWKSLVKVIDGSLLKGPQVLDNGATIAMAPSGEIVYSACLPASAVELTYRVAKERGFMPILCNSNDYYAYDIDSFSDNDMLLHKEYANACASEAELLSHSAECCKMAFFAYQPEDETHAFCDELNRLYKENALPVHGVFTEKEIIVIKLSNVNKMTGIRKACEIMGFSTDDVVAVGDGDNDIEMLAGCGVGIVVANATEKAMAVATHVVGSCDDAGFAQAVRMML